MASPNFSVGPNQMGAGSPAMSVGPGGVVLGPNQGAANLEQLQNQAQQMIIQQILAQYPQLVQGILPQGAQAGVDAEMEIITAELQRRGVQGEQQITNNLQRRGMLNSSLYANQVGDMNSAIVRQLAQSRQDVTQQAIANMLAALGFGGQTQNALAGQQVNLMNAKTAQEQAQWYNNLPNISLSGL